MSGGEGKGSGKSPFYIVPTRDNCPGSGPRDPYAKPEPRNQVELVLSDPEAASTLRHRYRFGDVSYMQSVGSLMFQVCFRPHEADVLPGEFLVVEPLARETAHGFKAQLLSLTVQQERVQILQTTTFCDTPPPKNLGR